MLALPVPLVEIVAAATDPNKGHLRPEQGARMGYRVTDASTAMKLEHVSVLRPDSVR
jgi:hypothetical protein